MSATCGHCGATVRTSAARFCEFCGTELPRAAAAAPPSRFGDLPARFAALRAHQDLHRLMRLAPSALGHQASNIAGAVFAVIFLAVSGVIFVGFQAVAPPPFSFFPLIFVAVGVWILVRSLGRGARLASEPLRHVPALVVDERTAVSGGSGDSASHTTWFVTLETEDGRRDEYEAGGRLAGRVAPGDMGLAYVKAGVLLDFRRLPV